MLARQCHAAAAAVEEGMPLEEALTKARFPDTLTALVGWGQRKTCLAESLRAAAEAFEARINAQSALLRSLVAPIIYMLILTFIGFSVAAMWMPVLCLISESGTVAYVVGGGFLKDSRWINVLMISSTAVFPLGVVMLMATRWYTGPAPGDRKLASATVARAFAWVLTAASFVVGIFLLLPGVAILWFASLAVIIAMAYSNQAAAQRYALLALVGTAADRSIPLETAFAAFGHERGGWMRRRTAEIVYMLYHGASLPAALKAVPGVLPPEAVPLVCVGHESGSLGPAIDQALAVRNLDEPVWQSIVGKLGYICILPAAAVGIITLIIRYFKYIFRDYNLALPAIPFGLSDWSGWEFLRLLLGAASLFSAGLLVYGVLRHAGSIRWDLPGMGWLLRRRHTARMLDALALAARRQRPLGEALSTLASSYPQRSIERRLWAAYDDLQAGGDDLQCLYARGLLGKTDLALLQAARRNGNLAWAARELADSSRRRFIYHIQALLYVIFPPVIVGYGLLVAAIAVAIFLPLISLIRNMAS